MCSLQELTKTIQNFQLKNLNHEGFPPRERLNIRVHKFMQKSQSQKFPKWQMKFFVPTLYRSSIVFVDSLDS